MSLKFDCIINEDQYFRKRFMNLSLTRYYCSRIILAIKLAYQMSNSKGIATGTTSTICALLLAKLLLCKCLPICYKQNSILHVVSSILHKVRHEALIELIIIIVITPIKCNCAKRFCFTLVSVYTSVCMRIFCS